MRAHREVRHLGLRVALFVIGAGVGFAGMWADLGWLVDVAIVVLMIGFALRFLPHDRSEGEASHGDPHPGH